MAPDHYLELLDQAERTYQVLIADPSSDASEIREAGYRCTLTRKAYESLTSSALSPAEWREAIERQVARELRSPSFAQQLEQVKLLGQAIVANPELLKQGWPAV